MPIEENKIVSGEITAAYFNVKSIHLKSFNSVLGDIKIANCTPADLSNYKAQRKKLNLSDSYIDQEIWAAKSMIITAFNNGKVDGEILRVFRMCKKLLKKVQIPETGL